MQTNKINIFNHKVSVFSKVTDIYPLMTATIMDVLMDDKIKDKVEEYRRTGNKKIKMSMPCFTPSGIFSQRKDSRIIEHNNVICIDVDKKDNIDLSNFDELKSLIAQIPFVAYCGLSCGGEGYFILIPIKHPDRHREHFYAICEDFERCGLSIDRSCVNLSRLRIMSYDDSAYFNRRAIVYSETIKTYPQQRKSFVFLNNTDNDITALINQISSTNTDITGDYKQWLEIGAAIAGEFGEHGRQYFHAISKFSDKYSFSIADRKFNECLKMSSFRINTLFYYAKRYGFIVK